MRRLLTWIAVLTTCFAIPILGVSVPHGAVVPETCVQLLDPASGSVLTVNASTGHALMDARTLSPLPFDQGATQTTITSVSPDQRYVMTVRDDPTNGVGFWLGRRSTTKRGLLTSNGLHYRWSPDSRYVAFTEMRDSSASLINLAIVRLDGSYVSHAALPDPAVNNAIMDWALPVWSPDSTIVALHIYSGAMSQSAAALVLQAVDTDQSIYVRLQNEQIMFVEWSPDSQTILIFTNDHLYVVNRAGQIVNKTPSFFLNYKMYSLLAWSPDGQYLSLINSNVGNEVNYLLDVMTVTGIHVFDAPLRAKEVLWSAQPHTLVYVTHAPDKSGVFVLDAANGTITSIAETMPAFDPITLSPDESLKSFDAPIESLIWYDTDYYAISTRTQITLYHRRDDKVLFTGTPPSDVFIAMGTINDRDLKVFVAPDKRAALTYYNRTFINEYRHLYLLPTDIPIANGVFTEPAWMANGAIFAFAERNTAGWMLRIMDRDGTVLHQINLPAYTTEIAYDYVRWTNCD